MLHLCIEGIEWILLPISLFSADLLISAWVLFECVLSCNPSMIVLVVPVIFSWYFAFDDVDKLGTTRLSLGKYSSGTGDLQHSSDLILFVGKCGLPTCRVFNSFKDFYDSVLVFTSV